MKTTLAPGVTATSRLTIDRERTIDFMGEKARVYATPMLVRDIEIPARTRSARASNSTTWPRR
jgi:fluoroacetyl-CoA thioesterase